MQQKSIVVKLALTSICFFYFGTPSIAALEDSIQKQADQLLQDKKYLSAFRLLDRLESSNLDPDLIVRKADALLHGMIRIADLTTFYLREGLADPQNSGSLEGTVAIRFPLLQTLQDALAAWPRNSALWAQLGSYHFMVFKNSNITIELQDASAAAALDAYLKSTENGAADAWVLGRIGILYTWREDLEQAVSFLRAAQAKQEQNPEIQYDLAYALYLKGEVATALPFAQFAKENLKTGVNHQNALLLYADIQLGLQDVGTASQIYEDLYSQDNTNLYPLRRLIECYLISGDTVNLEKYTRVYIETNPSDAASFYRLTNMFLQYQKPGMLISIAHNLKAKYQNRKPEMAGLMSFYEAMLFAGNNQTKEAMASLEDAKKFLLGVYAEDHPINQQIRELNQRLK